MKKESNNGFIIVVIGVSLLFATMIADKTFLLLLGIIILVLGIAVTLFSKPKEELKKKDGQ